MIFKSLLLHFVHREVNGPAVEIKIEIAQSLLFSLAAVLGRGRFEGLDELHVGAVLRTADAANAQRNDDEKTQTGRDATQCRYGICYKVATSVEAGHNQRRCIVTDVPHNRKLNQVNLTINIYVYFTFKKTHG